MRYFSLACSSYNCIANLLVSISLWVRQYNRSPASPCKKPAIGGTYKNEFVTDQNGEIDLFGLEPGAYTMKELAAPSGYLVDDAIRIVQINPGENAQFVFTDTCKPTMEMIKYDSQNGTFVPGATIRIAKIEDRTHYRTTRSYSYKSLSLFSFLLFAKISSFFIVIPPNHSRQVYLACSLCVCQVLLSSIFSKFFKMILFL